MFTHLKCQLISANMFHDTRVVYGELRYCIRCISAKCGHRFSEHIYSSYVCEMYSISQACIELRQSIESESVTCQGMHLFIVMVV